MLFSIDMLNIWFIVLLLILLPINLNICVYESKLKIYNWLLLLIYISLNLCFIIINLMLFFLMFELMVITLFMLLYSFILSYYRLRSSYWFFLYSLIGSMCMIIGIVYIVVSMFQLLLFTTVSSSNYLLLFLFMLFIIKIPSWPFNFWLIEVHAEANTSLSLVLAALLLKLGIYGICKYCFNSLSLVLLSFSLIALVVFVLSVVVLVFYNLRLYDYKKIIALSSLIHLNFSLIALFSLNLISYMLLILNSVAHGFSSFLMFMLFGYIIYKSYTRFIDSLYFLSYLFKILVFMSFLINISFPLSFNFLVELYTIVLLVNISLLLSISFIVVSFISLFFYFLLFNRFKQYTFSGTLLYLSIIELVYTIYITSINLFYGIYFISTISFIPLRLNIIWYSYFINFLWDILAFCVHQSITIFSRTCLLLLSIIFNLIGYFVWIFNLNLFLLFVILLHLLCFLCFCYRVVFYFEVSNILNFFLILFVFNYLYHFLCFFQYLIYTFNCSLHCSIFCF